MALRTTVLIALFLLPVLSLAAEYLLTRKSYRAALWLPVIVMCLGLFFGIYAVLTGGLMYLVYFTAEYLKKRKREEEKDKLSEMERMNIHDLE